MNRGDIAILNTKGSDYRCIISRISKNEAINVMRNADLTEKNWNIIKPNTNSNFEAVNLFQILI